MIPVREKGKKKIKLARCRGNGTHYHGAAVRGLVLLEDEGM